MTKPILLAIERMIAILDPAIEGMMTMMIVMVVAAMTMTARNMAKCPE